MQMYGKLSHRSFCSITAVSHVPKQFSCSYIISYFQICIRVQMCVVVICTTIAYDTNPPTRLRQKKVFRTYNALHRPN